MQGSFYWEVAIFQGNIPWSIFVDKGWNKFGEGVAYISKAEWKKKKVDNSNKLLTKMVVAGDREFW